jgi:hypothetical protein
VNCSARTIDVSEMNCCVRDASGRYCRKSLEEARMIAGERPNTYTFGSGSRQFGKFIFARGMKKVDACSEQPPTAVPAPGAVGVARDDYYPMRRGTILRVEAPGVLSNDDIGDLGDRARVEFAPYSSFPNGSGFTNLDNGRGGFIFDLSGPGANQITGTVRLGYVIHSPRGDSNIAALIVEVRP